MWNALICKSQNLHTVLTRITFKLHTKLYSLGTYFYTAFVHQYKYFSPTTSCTRYSNFSQHVLTNAIWRRADVRLSPLPPFLEKWHLHYMTIVTFNCFGSKSHLRWLFTAFFQIWTEDGSPWCKVYDKKVQSGDEAPVLHTEDT